MMTKEGSQSFTCPSLLERSIQCIGYASLQEGDESYPLYKKERDGLLDSLKRRAEMIEGVCLFSAVALACGETFVQYVVTCCHQPNHALLLCVLCSPIHC